MTTNLNDPSLTLTPNQAELPSDLETPFEPIEVDLIPTQELASSVRPEVTRHLNAVTVKALRLTNDARMRMIMGDNFVRYTAFGTVVNEAQWLIEEPRRSRASGLIVVGQSGNGKSSIANRLSARYPSNGKNANYRIINITASGVRQTSAMFKRILEKTGAPRTPGTNADLERLVLSTLRNMNCRLLMIDEIQDVLKANIREQTLVLEVIKLLMNELKLSVMALGTYEAEKAFRADEHLNDRFQCFCLPEWTEGAELAAFLSGYESMLPLRLPSDLARPEIQKILIERSSGILDRMIKLLRSAAVMAVHTGAEQITAKDLSTVAPRPPVAVLRGTA